MRRAACIGIGFLIAAGLSPVLSLAEGAPVHPADWSKVVVAAEKEGKVVLYGQQNLPELVRLKESFEKAYPKITLEYSRVLGGAIVGKLEAERNSNAEGADVVVATEPLWLDQTAKAGGFTKPFGPAMKEWPASAMIGGSAPILSIQPFVLAYNTNLVHDPITGYQDVLNPKYKGLIGTTEPIAPVLVAWYDWLEKTQGADFLKRLAAQNPKFYTGANPAAQALASGELGISTFNVITPLTALMKQGAPIKIVTPHPMLGTPFVGAVLGWAHRPNAAMVLVDYMMSRPGQTMWNGTQESASPLPNIPGSLDASVIQLYDAQAYPASVVDTFMARWKTIIAAH